MIQEPINPKLIKVNEELQKDLEKINLSEMFISVEPSLPPNISNSIYYSRIKHLLYGEIVGFCREQTDLKEDLNNLRQSVGAFLAEDVIREYLDGLKQKYNTINNNISIEYHIETTRVDYGVPVFVTIKRDDCYQKLFVYRFRKGPTTGLSNLTNSGV